MIHFSCLAFKIIKNHLMVVANATSDKKKTEKQMWVGLSVPCGL